MSRADLESIASHLGPSVVVDTHHQHGDETLVIHAEHVQETMRHVKQHMGYDMLVDLTAVDHLGHTPRFEVVYHLRSMKTGARLRVKAQVAQPEDDSLLPAIQSVCALWPVANWLEREVWDMYGIRFLDHPDLRRILMYEEFVGHPLRKDYPKDKRQPLVRRENLLPDQGASSVEDSE